MSENREALCDMADGLFAELADADFAEVWERLEQAGFALLLIPERDGGFGGDWSDLAAVMRLAGLHALAAPLGEHVIARWLLRCAGVEAPKGLVTLADSPQASVPWGRHAAYVIVAGEGGLQLATGLVSEGESPAGEPRDRIDFDLASAARLDIDAEPLALIAFLRTCQAAGTLDAALRLSIDHCSQRQQFGRALSQFQAVQQSIALLASEAAAVNCAAQGAAAALDRFGPGKGARFEIAAAKLRTNGAIKLGCALAHQVHGAIGFTRDYALHSYTRRMMGWRSEGGNDVRWALHLGQVALDWGGAGLWEQLTSRTDPV